jgi:hypothetical protein
VRKLLAVVLFLLALLVLALGFLWWLATVERWVV